MLSACVGCCCRLCQGQLCCVGVVVEFSSSNSRPSVFVHAQLSLYCPPQTYAILLMFRQNQSNMVKQATLTGYCRVLACAAGWGCAGLHALDPVPQQQQQQQQHVLGHAPPSGVGQQTVYTESCSFVRDLLYHPSCGCVLGVGVE